MTGHTPWSEIRRKVNDRLAQNGSRLGDHRKQRVPATNWMVLIAIIAALFALSPTIAKGQYEPYTQGTGLIVQYAEVCFTPELSSEAINILTLWQRLVNELDAYERGGSAMNKEDALMGQLLFDNNICHTVADFYHVAILRRTEGYVLVQFDEQYTFAAGPMIVAARDVLPDRGI
jgi:hypothetical protein